MIYEFKENVCLLAGVEFMTSNCFSYSGDIWKFNETGLADICDINATVTGNGNGSGNGRPYVCSFAFQSSVF